MALATTELSKTALVNLSLPIVLTLLRHFLVSVRRFSKQELSDKHGITIMQGLLA